MGMTCIAGRAGAGKTTRCLSVIRQALAAGAPVIVLVPEQDTVQAELMLARQLELPVFWNLEVLSPTRLVRRVQGLMGGSARVWLSDAGRAMALRGAMLSLRDSLKYFKSGSQGAADSMGDFLVELKRGEADETALRLAADRLPADGALAQKLYDLAAIYEAYEGRMAGKYLDGEDALRACAAQIASCTQLSDYTVVADGFDVLPRTTLRMLAALAGRCRAVYASFSVCGQDAGDAALYEQSRLSMETLRGMCAEDGVPFAVEVLPDRALPDPGLEHLARNLFAQRPQRMPPPPSVHLVQARDPFMEAERAAGYLFEQCRTRSLRYRDMAVVCGDMDTYGERLKQAFERRNMRAYIDRAPTADRHPAAQYLLSAMAGAARYYRLDDMLRCLKSGCCGLSERECDRLELYAMEHGLEGKLWELPIEQQSEPTGAERPLEALRAQFFAPIAAFRAGGQTRTARAFAEDAVRLMDAADLPGQLYAMHEESREQGDLTRMQCVRQVQDAINSVLDQAVELCGQESMTAQDFIKLFRAGLSAVTLGSIPMSPDAVYVGDITRFKGRDVQLLYVVGMNADGIPSRHQDGGLLAENEKVLLREAAKQAGADIRINLLHNRAAVERFAIFGALISPRQELVLSWPAVSARGAANRESPLISRIRQRVFPGIPVECGVTGDGFVYAGARASMREALAAGLRARKNHVETEGLAGLEGAYKAAFPEDYAAVCRAVDASAADQRIDADTALALYQRAAKQRMYGVDGLVAGISQIETFALCPFAHFVGYGLRPRELREPQMDARERGTLEHKAVEGFMRAVGQETGELDDARAERLMDEALGPLFEEDAQRMRGRDGLAKAGHSQIRRTMHRVGRMLALQRRLSAFRTSAQEIAFRPGDLPPLRLAGGKKVYLEGKIDRVDVLDLPGGEYARVIDYKTGNNALEAEDIYYGLRLQLFLYLDAVLSMRGAHPAGVFYQKLGQAQVNLDGAMPDEKIAKKRDKKLRLTGYLLEDEEVISAMCADPDRMDELLPIAPRTSKGRALPGQYTKASMEKLLTEEQFSALRRHTRRKLSQLAQGMLDGDAAVSPAQTGDLDACKNCRFRAVCGFDESLPGCARRKLRMDAEQAMQAMGKDEDGA